MRKDTAHGLLLRSAKFIAITTVGDNSVFNKTVKHTNAES